MGLKSFAAMTNPGYSWTNYATISVASGDLIVVMGTNSSSVGWDYVSDTDGNSWSSYFAHSANSNLEIFSATAGSTNASLQVDLRIVNRQTSKRSFIWVFDSGDSLVDSGEQDNSSTTSHTMASVTNGASGCVIAGHIRSPSGGTTWSAGSTGWDVLSPGGYSNSVASYEEVASGTKSGEGWVSTTAINSATIAAAIDYGGGGGSVVPIIHQQLAV